ncbi:MAG: OstA family protein [Caulobacteraceae bacterium]|nr:OstA family protein [Caulobacteraceae bacterium]
MHKAALPLILAMAALSGAAAAPSMGLLGGGGPIDFSGDTGALNPKTCRKALTGNAWVTQGFTKLQARTLVLTGSQASGDCEYTHVEATGDVYFVTPDRTVRADRAIYDQLSSSAVFTADPQKQVIMVNGRNVATAAKLTINTETGEVAAEGDGSAAGRFRSILFPEPSYLAAGNGWSVRTSAEGVILNRGPGAASLNVGNPGLVANGNVLSWTTPQLKLTLTKGACSYGGQAYDYAAQVQAGASSYTGCGGPKAAGS